MQGFSRRDLGNRRFEDLLKKEVAKSKEQRINSRSFEKEIAETGKNSFRHIQEVWKKWQTDRAEGRNISRKAVKASIYRGRDWERVP